MRPGRKRSKAGGGAGELRSLAAPSSPSRSQELPGSQQSLLRALGVLDGSSIKKELKTKVEQTKPNPDV